MPECSKNDLYIDWIASEGTPGVQEAIVCGALVFRLPPHQKLTKKDVEDVVRELWAEEPREWRNVNECAKACDRLEWSMESRGGGIDGYTMTISDIDFHEDDRPLRYMQTSAEREAEDAE